MTKPSDVPGRVQHVRKALKEKRKSLAASHANNRQAYLHMAQKVKNLEEENAVLKKDKTRCSNKPMEWVEILRVVDDLCKENGGKGGMSFSIVRLETMYRVKVRDRKSNSAEPLFLERQDGWEL